MRLAHAWRAAAGRSSVAAASREEARVVAPLGGSTGGAAVCITLICNGMWESALQGKVRVDRSSTSPPQRNECPRSRACTATVRRKSTTKRDGRCRSIGSACVLSRIWVAICSRSALRIGRVERRLQHRRSSSMAIRLLMMSMPAPGRCPSSRLARSRPRRSPKVASGASVSRSSLAHSDHRTSIFHG